MNHEILQMDTPQGTLYSSKEFENREQLAGRYIAIPGAIIMLIAGFFHIRKRYRKIKQQDILQPEP